MRVNHITFMFRLFGAGTRHCLKSTLSSSNYSIEGSRRLAHESQSPRSSKKLLAAFSFLKRLSSITALSESVQRPRLDCLVGLSATTNLFPSRPLSGKPAQTLKELRVRYSRHHHNHVHKKDDHTGQILSME